MQIVRSVSCRFERGKIDEENQSVEYRLDGSFLLTDEKVAWYCCSV